MHAPITTTTESTTTQKQMRMEERECFLLSFIFFSLLDPSRSFFLHLEAKKKLDDK
jgi:hypothetical protein